MLAAAGLVKMVIKNSLPQCQCLVLCQLHQQDSGFCLRFSESGGFGVFFFKEEAMAK